MSTLITTPDFPDPCPFSGRGNPSLLWMSSSCLTVKNTPSFTVLLSSGWGAPVTSHALPCDLKTSGSSEGIRIVVGTIFRFPASPMSSSLFIIHAKEIESDMLSRSTTTYSCMLNQCNMFVLSLLAPLHIKNNAAPIQQKILCHFVIT